MLNFSVVVPTRNGGDTWREAARRLAAYVNPLDVFVIDSESTDGSDQVSLDNGFNLIRIEKKDFNHGGTRKKGAAYVKDKSDIVIFMTQDAILHDEEAVPNLLKAFRDPDVTAATGRQLPHEGASLSAANARLFNYPELSRVSGLAEVECFGIKAAFCSNSFAAYRMDSFFSCGGFSEDIIFGEDMCLAAKMILSGFKVAYVAEAKVFHSHDYSLLEEFKRSVDVGVFHSKESWLIDTFGKAEGEGVRFAVSEIRMFLRKSQYGHAFFSVLRSAAKYLGYFIGRRFFFFPVAFMKKVSMNSGYWG